MLTLYRSVVANETHITVGHEREESGTVRQIHKVFSTNDVKLTDLWVHIAVVRQHEGVAMGVLTQCSSTQSVAAARAVCSRTDTACECPLCGTSASQQTSTYRVYLDGVELFQVGVAPSDIEVTCGPRCNSATCVDASSGALNFGTYWGPNVTTAKAMYLDGWLDEWRFWNGVRSQLKIQDNRKVIMGPAREFFTGDPTEGVYGSCTLLLL